MTAPPRTRTAASGRRAALRRLVSYVRRNRAYYGVWLVVTLAYVGGLRGGSMAGGLGHRSARDGPAGAEVAVRRAGWVAGGGHRHGLRALLLAHARLQRRARDRVRDPQRSLRSPRASAAAPSTSSWRTGEMMSRCVNDVNSVRLLLGVGLLNLVADARPLLRRHRHDAGHRCAPRAARDPPVPGLHLDRPRTLGRAIHHWSLEVQERLADLSNQLQETIAGIAVVKAYAMEDLTERRFDDANQNALRPPAASSPSPTPPCSPWSRLLPATAMLARAADRRAGATPILNGTDGGGVLHASPCYMFQLTFPTFIMGWVVALVQRGAASMQRIDEMLWPIEPTIADREDAVTPGDLRGEIEFRNLTFRYPGSEREPALRDVDARDARRHDPRASWDPWARARAPSRQLIPRLYEVEDGKLFVDGIDVNRIAAADPALAHRHGAAGVVPLLHAARRQRRLRPRGHRGGGGAPRLPARPAGQGRERVAPRLRHRGGRARRDALGRAAPAHGAGARAGSRPPHPDPRRHALGGRRRDRGGDPARARRRCSTAARWWWCRPGSARCATRTSIVVLDDGAHGRVAARTPSSWPGGVSTRGWRASRRKSSWRGRRERSGGRAHQRPRGDARGGGPRQGLRRPAAAAPVALRAPYRWQVALTLGLVFPDLRCSRWRPRGSSRPGSTRSARRRPRATRASSTAARARGGHARSALGLVGPAVAGRPLPGDGAHRLRAPVPEHLRDDPHRPGTPCATCGATSSRTSSRLHLGFFDKLPRGAARDPRHQRRGERGRDVLGGHRRARHRPAQDDGLRDGALPREPAKLAAAHLPRGAGPRDRGDGLPLQGASGVPAGACAHRAHQRLHPGERHRA